MMEEVRIGLIGIGYTDKAHVTAYAWAPTVFNLHGKLVREMAAEVFLELVVKRTQVFDFNRSIGNWRVLVANLTADIADIYFPNHLHRRMALEAIRHDEHVYPEKPLVLNAHDAREVVKAVQWAGVKTLVRLSYVKNPTTRLAKRTIERGEIGEAIHLYGAHNEDYMADPLISTHWHCFKEIARLGALGGLVAHIANMAQYLVGDIQQVCDGLKVAAPQRPAKIGSSQMVAVENEDQVHAMMCFAGDMQGVIETSRVACGRKMGLLYVITGTKGTIGFVQECTVELKLYLHDDPANRQGLRTLLIGPMYLDYGAFCMGAGHSIGFNDQKTAEVRDLVDGIAADTPMRPDSGGNWEMLRVLDAVTLSHQGGRWLNVSDIV